jgi:hypothetical protein
MQNAAFPDRPEGNRFLLVSGSKATAQRLHQLAANFTAVPNEIWDMKRPGLTPEIRWTLLFLARETIGKAFLQGGSPYDFASVSWDRWMEALELQTIAEVQARLAHMEKMGLIEIQPGNSGARGHESTRCRLRWANGGQPAAKAYKAVNRKQDSNRKNRPGDKGIPR